MALSGADDERTVFNPAPQRFDKISDVPTETLATRFVGMLIMAKGDISKWQAASETLIRELRGEPQPS